MRGGDGGKSFERVDHRLIGDDTTAEVLAEHRLESHGVDLVRAGDDAVALQRGEGVINHTGIIGHPFVATLGNNHSAALIHAEEAVFEGSRTKIGNENEHEMRQKKLRQKTGSDFRQWESHELCFLFFCLPSPGLQSFFSPSTNRASRGRRADAG